MTLTEQAGAAKRASYELMTLSTGTKNAILLAMADALVAHAQEILKENEKDMEKAREKGISTAMLDRLRLSEARIEGMAQGLRKVAALPDPIGDADAEYRRPNGLQIAKRRVPLGVIGIIYEARPNVTADAIGLCIKSGNSCVLRGGSEAICSNIAVAGVMEQAGLQAGMPQGAVQLITDTSRETVNEMMRLTEYLDVLIPRGGQSLIRSVVENARVPAIQTGLGNCHTYVDATADVEMAATIVYNAKCSRPAVCNAIETLLVHSAVAEQALPVIAEKLEQNQVELRGCARTVKILPQAVAAQEQDWAEEYDDYILAIKVVDSLQEAIDHINRYGTKHSECIVTESYTNAQTFLEKVDAAAVYVNASTRFTDGEEFGFGAEIGISTQKLHARGPMGLKELTTVKYVIRGDGQVR